MEPGVPQGSWAKKYDEVDSDVPLFKSPHHEGETMSQSPSTPDILSTSTSPEPSSPILPSFPRPAKHPSIGHEPFLSNFPPTMIDSTTTTTTTTTTANPDNTVSSSNSTGNVQVRSPRTTVSSTIKSFPSSPLKPSGPTSFAPTSYNRTGSRGSTFVNRIASEESRALASHHSISHSGSRGSMILYRCVDLTHAPEETLLPPSRSHLNRHSILSISGDSIVSISSDSKYPTATIGSERGLIAYAYDPSLDELGTTPAEDDYLHDSDKNIPQPPGLFSSVSFRGVFNVLSLVALISALMCLFVVYPVIRFYHDNTRNALITFNTKINGSGQASANIVDRRSQILFAAPIPLIDSSTPLPARMLKSVQDIDYGLVFSDEFTRKGMLFGADQDSIWETASRGASERGDEEDLSSSEILRMKIPLCLSRGGFVEVGIRNKTVGCNTWSGSRTGGKEGEESTLRRFLYWPGSADSSWSSLNQSDVPNVPADLLSTLRFDFDSATSLVLSIGISMDDRRRRAATLHSDARSWVAGRWHRSQKTEVEVDYVRMYQPIKPSSRVAVMEETKWDCAAAQHDVILDLLEV